MAHLQVIILVDKGPGTEAKGIGAGSGTMFHLRRRIWAI